MSGTREIKKVCFGVFGFFKKVTHWLKKKKKKKKRNTAFFFCLQVICISDLWPKPYTNKTACL